MLNQYQNGETFVSILIPMYQAEKYILEAVESAVRQDVRKEIVIADDGSTDGGLRILQDYQAAGGEIRIVPMAHRGQAAARNAALQQARGNFILYLDADDILTDHAAEKLLEGFSEDPGAGVVCAKCRDFISPDLSDAEAENLRIQPEPYFRMLSGCTMIRSEVYERVGLFDESLPSSETAQWMLRMSDTGIRVHQIDAVTLMRRYHSSNFGRVSRQTQLKSYMEIIKQRRKADDHGK